MEHIRQFDWCSSDPDIYFLKERDIDNCVMQRILQNKFRDPLVSSDSEDEAVVKPKINWNEILKRTEKDDRFNRIVIPGLRAIPPYPKISALTIKQHYQCLKVLCSENPNILEAEFMARPTKQDHKVFEEVKQIYVDEQQEFIEWAKTLWVNNQCVRALRPKPDIEMVYEAEYKMRAKRMQSFPKHYQMAAQIPLENKNSHKCEMVYEKDLINVNVTVLPRIECPDQIMKKFTIIQPLSVPEPCDKHPCRFVLPSESQMSILPLTEIHRGLAEYAADNGAQYIASETALKCMVELDRCWELPVSVCSVINADGDKTNVIVLGSEFSTQRESAQARTYRAFRHLLEFSMIPPSQKSRMLQTQNDAEEKKKENGREENVNDMEVTSDEEDDSLVIDTGDDLQMDINESDSEKTEHTNTNKRKHKTIDMELDKEQNGEKQKNDGFYNCTCKDSQFENPPPRSFKKWQIRNSTLGEKFDIIVHCSHKVRGETGEVILEPIPEYQLDLGGSKQSEDKIKSLALSLYLRRKASLINVRVDNATGDVVTIDKIYLEEYLKRHGDVVQDVTNTVHTAISQLQGLLPGNYILQHEPSHGSNALLYVSRANGPNATMTLNFDVSQPGKADEASTVKAPPLLTPVLLPCHKFRKILPCAFTPFPKQVAKETKKPVTRQRTPPQAIKWPKRKQKKKTTNQ